MVRALRSTLLDRHGFRHGFATRLGGVSQAPRDTLNLGYHLGDDENAVRENRERFLRAVGLTRDRLFEQRQVHATAIREILPRDRPEAIADIEGDGLIVRVAEHGVAARTADCVPILIGHPPSGHVAAVHAGWRGAVAGVVSAGIEALAHDPAELVVAIGPHIRVGAFEIGEEVAAEMENAAGDDSVIERAGPKPHGDLAALIRIQLRRSGVPDRAIDDLGGCTHTDVGRFFSHRRDHGETGRHLSVIIARKPA
ncbi:MAG: peptidoglycan editing factor PgeF [Myxococcales bacterium]|nr:peptidoglycan editing factor PgeF [Myxococcales bacterium]MDH3485869.1 peptidoglycan editing factor PgeF [Myxococcales bacterium]